MSAARRIFGFLLFLYPPEHRATFGREMAILFELRMMAAGNRFTFLMSEAAGLLAGAAREWFSRHSQPVPAAAGFVDRRLPKDVVDARLRVDEVIQRMVYAISHHQFEQARRLSYEEREERENLRRVCDLYGIDPV